MEENNPVVPVEETVAAAETATTNEETAAVEAAPEAVKEEVVEAAPEEVKEEVVEAAPKAKKKPAEKKEAPVAPVAESFDWDAYEKGDSYGTMSKEDLEKAYDNTLNTVKDK